MADAKISIIIPVYNGELYLRECIDSVINQTLYELEIICIDDNSTDGSWNVLKKYAEADVRFKLLHSEENQGSGIARNSGLIHATGEFVAFLDCDDFFLDPGALEAMYAACRKHKVSVCGSLRNTLLNGLIQPSELGPGLLERSRGEELIEYKDYQYDYNYQSFIFERSLIVNNNLRFPPYRRFEDPPFLVRAMFYAGTFCVAPVELHVFRKNEQSEERKTMYLTDALKGLSDNLSFSRKHRLAKLHQQTVMRIEEEFGPLIINHISDDFYDIVKLLFHANKEVDTTLLGEDGYSGEQPFILKTFRDLGEISAFKAAEKEEVLASHRQLTRWLVLKLYGRRVADFLKEQDISTVAIYGMGFFGLLLLKELEGSAVQVRFGIDRRNSSNIGYPVYPPGRYPEKVDAIIVTPLKNKEILMSLDLENCGQLFPLNDVINKMFDDLIAMCGDMFQSIL